MPAESEMLELTVLVLLYPQKRSSWNANHSDCLRQQNWRRQKKSESKERKARVDIFGKCKYPAFSFFLFYAAFFLLIDYCVEQALKKD